MKDKKKARCEKCNSTLTYLRIKTNERVCRKCGHVQKIKRVENGVNKTTA